ncbi:hypothetical protein C1646_773417 [Rhizophagus diaphanus]|nr:hypothetical protein C1646_773417 [Rhizophagus diaphanus] [Rhizophagus sp. MUCL 43196]
MADIYDALEEIKNKHEIEKYVESRDEYQTDPSCLKCYKINEGEEPEMFKKFWKVFQKVILEAMSYNKNTIEKWLEYVKLTRKEGGEIYPFSGKKRSKELIKIREKGEKLIDLEEAKLAEVKNKEYNTMKYFKEILHMEESIAEEENREKVRKFQKTKIIEEKGFIEEYNDVEELISSNDTEGPENSDEQYEMILRNYWIENGYKIDIKKIKRILDFGVEHKVMKTKDFMEYYVTIKELDNEEIIKELKKWYNTNIIECLLCQKMILIKEAMDYNKEFEGRICKSYSENKKNNNRIELRIKKIMEICERTEVKITREEIIQVLKMGYEDKEILSWGFIKLFQENKNELEEVIKEILDKYLKKEINTEENENEDNDEIMETEERLRRIKELVKYLEIEVNEGELLIKIRRRNKENFR